MSKERDVQIARANKLFSDAKIAYGDKKYDLGATYYRQAAIIYDAEGDKTNSALASYGEFSCYYYDNRFATAVTIGRKMCKTNVFCLPDNYLEPFFIMHGYALSNMDAREESNIIYNKVISINKGEDFSKWYVYAYRAIAINYAAMGNISEAAKNFKIASNLYAKLGMTEDMNYCDDRIRELVKGGQTMSAETENVTPSNGATIEGEMDYYESGKKCFEDAFALYGENGDITSARQVLVRMADESVTLGDKYFDSDRSLFTLEHYEKYIQVYTKARVLYVMLKDKANIDKCSKALSEIVMDKCQYFADNNKVDIDRMLRMCIECRDMLTSIGAVPKDIDTINDLMAKACFRKGEMLLVEDNYSTAYKYYDKAHYLYLQGGNIMGIGDSLARMMLMLIRIGNVGEAKKLLSKGKAILIETKNPFMVESINELNKM